MGNFETNLKTWSCGSQEKEDKVANFMSELNNRSEQIYRNISEDPEISFETYARFFEFVVSASSADPMKVLTDFCWYQGVARSGRARQEAGDATLGALKTRDAVLEAMAESATASTLKGLQQTLLNSALIAEEVDLQRQILQSRAITHPQRTAWSWFKPDNRTDPFENIQPTRDLVRRLGLSISDDKLLIIWGHSPVAQEVLRWPTAFDAADNPLYRPGGKTFPTSLHPDHGNDGLDEVVHPAVTGENIAVRMIQVT